MPDETPQLSPANVEDLQRALAFALIFDGKKRFRRAEDLMAEITARHLVEHLEKSGFVVLRRPATQVGAGALMRGYRKPDGGS